MNVLMVYLHNWFSMQVLNVLQEASRYQTRKALYTHIVSWLRTRLSYVVVMCIHGTNPLICTNTMTHVLSLL